MIWFATLKSRGSHILFISAYKSIEIEAEGIFLKSRQDFSPHKSLKVEFPPVSTILVALLGWEIGKKWLKWNLATKAGCACWGICSCQWTAEILWCTGTGRGKWGIWHTSLCQANFSDKLNFCGNVSDQNASKKNSCPLVFISWLSVTTWGIFRIFQNFAFPPPNLDEGMESAHVQSTRPYWWQDITWCNEEFLLQRKINDILSCVFHKPNDPLREAVPFPSHHQSVTKLERWDVLSSLQFCFLLQTPWRQI